MCYLPELKYIALSNWKDYVLKVIHCETGEGSWEVKEKVEGVV